MLNENLTPEDLAAMVAAALLDGENGPFEMVASHGGRVVYVTLDGASLGVFAHRGDPVDAGATTLPLQADSLYTTVIAPPEMAEATFESVAFVIREVMRKLSEKLRDRVAPLIAAKQAVDGVSVAESPSAEARAKGAEMAAATFATRAAE